MGAPNVVAKPRVSQGNADTAFHKPAPKHFKITVHKERSFVPAGGSTHSETISILRDILDEKVSAGALEEILNDPEAVAQLSPIALLSKNQTLSEKYQLDVIARTRGRDTEIFISISMLTTFEFGSPEKPKKDKFRTTVYTARVDATERPRVSPPKKHIVKKEIETPPPKAPAPQESAYIPPKPKKRSFEEIVEDYKSGSFFSESAPRFKNKCNSVSDPNCWDKTDLQTFIAKASNPIVDFDTYEAPKPCMGDCIPEPLCYTKEGIIYLHSLGLICVPCGSQW